MTEKGSVLPLFTEKLNVRNWLAEEVSNVHWLNVNKDTIADVSFGLFSDK